MCLQGMDACRQGNMSIRGAVGGCVLAVCLVAMMVESTEGHITFFSPREMMLMKEREGKKVMEPRSEDGQFQEASLPQLPETVSVENPQDRTIEIAVRLSAQQLYHVTPVLEEIIREIAEEQEKGEVFSLEVGEVYFTPDVV
ncbi:hypothetical protein N1851_011236 [Merluccius polli]|uniref:Uncharacterized protein n=1 Tax=Merluccius polli TaxID=89951 RepID=A0AA47P2Q4_MERPO|nr:hypothetical protein N1851_011236 [Merluccius polli]